MQDMTAVLLQEIRGLRGDLSGFKDEVAGWRQETAERIAMLETHDKDISGNGQPGRMKTLEDRVSGHSRIFWIGSGVLLSVQAGIGFVMKFWPWGKH